MHRTLTSSSTLLKLPESKTVCEIKIYSTLIRLLILMMVLLVGCGKGPVVSGGPKVGKPATEKALPANFVVCIDNSRSILPPEQILIREITMLMADLADSGDRIDVITFGRGATLAASCHIRSDADRITFKNQLRREVNFSEDYSDLRAAIRLLGGDPRSPFVRKGFAPYVIMLSDGKLEPADGNTRQAFTEMAEILQKQLANVNLYAVVLGNTYCNDIILKNIDGSDLDGKTLMKKYVAKSMDHFFHAEKMDQLLEIAVNILSRAKGITSLGEKAKNNQFRIDDSVESMTFIVRKRSTNGMSLFDSSDIVVNKPEGAPGKGESIYRSTDYGYFDLIVVRNPREGMWSISLANGGKPEVLSKIVTPLELRCDLRNSYYLNESSFVKAWIFNKGTGKIVADQTFTLKAHLAKDRNLEESNVYAEFHPDRNNGQYYLEVPTEVLRTLKSEGRPAAVSMEVIAQRFKPKTEVIDPWFVRRSSPAIVSFVEPFCDWVLREDRVFKIPFIGRLLHRVLAVPTVDEGLHFGATVDPKRSYYPPFDGLPRLKFVVERFDAGAKSYQPVVEKTLNGADEGGKIIYDSREMIREPGRYRYAYSLDGVVKNAGPFGIKSAYYAFEIQSYTMATWGLLLVLLFFIVGRFSSIVAKLKGDLTVKIYEGGKVVKSYDEQIYQKRYESDTFSLYARRSIFFKPRVMFKPKREKVNVIVDDEIKQGKKQSLEPGEHKIVVRDSGGETIIQADLYV